jgi:multiple antibiotic resistance protein
MWTLNIVEIVSAFVVLFAIIDILGAIPIFLSLKSQGKEINAGKASLISFAMFAVFFFAGDRLLNLFNVDVASFAVAGSFVIFILALEMILGIEIIKTESMDSGATLVPVAFPLIAGPGALTTLLSLRAEYSLVNIMIGLIANLFFVYLVLRFVDRIEKMIGGSGIFILRKFFGVILLAIAVKLFATNLTIMISK